MSAAAKKKEQTFDAGALSNKIEVAETCGGVVTLRVEEARSLKDALLQRDALADLVGEALRLGDPARQTEVYDAHAAEFLAKTGMLAVGKDVPAAMGGESEAQHAGRHAAWSAFLAGKRADLLERMRAALRAAGRVP